MLESDNFEGVEEVVRGQQPPYYKADELDDDDSMFNISSGGDM